MPDKYYSDWEQLVAAANKTIPTILKKDVSPIAEQILLKHIKRDIYEAYTPKQYAWVGGETYRRRYSLYNIVSIYGTDRGEPVLTVTSNATPTKAVVKGYSFHNRRPGSFLQLIESDNHGIWRGGFSRPAVANAQKEIDTSSRIQSAIKRGIKREIGDTIEI